MKSSTIGLYIHVRTERAWRFIENYFCFETKKYKLDKMYDFEVNYVSFLK